MSLKPLRNPAWTVAVVCSCPPLRYPITGTGDLCAFAASGHAAAPPSPAMNSRRLISSIGFLRTELSKLGRSQPLCARLKGYHPEGAADRLLHRGISVAPAGKVYGRYGSYAPDFSPLSPAFMSEMAPIPTEFCAPQGKSLSATSGLNVEG